MKKVVIVQRILSKYRVPFFSSLREHLAKKQIAVDLLHGSGRQFDQQRNILGFLKWAKIIPEKYGRIGSINFVFQPYWQYLKSADLIVVQQEMSWVLNYFLLLKRKTSRKHVAFWGHGLNWQINRNSWKNRVKTRLITEADWWFAYTPKVAELVHSVGFPKEQITVVENAIDTQALVQQKALIQPEELLRQRERLGIPAGAPTGIFCGAMYKEKRLDFLLEACIKIKESKPDFHMIFLGAGPEEQMLAAMSQKHRWMHWAGPAYGEKKILYFMLSDIALMPGLVGLAVLDSFVLETPLVTTQYPFHSPEIEYLQRGKNGMITENDLESFVAGAIALLDNSEERAVLAAGCRESAQYYTMARMVGNFSQGVEDCLEYLQIRQTGE